MRRVDSSTVDFEITLDLHDPYFEGKNCRLNSHSTDRFWVRYSQLRFKIKARLHLRSRSAQVLDSSLLGAWGYDRGISSFWLRTKIFFTFNPNFTRNLFYRGLTNYVNYKLPAMLNEEIQKFRQLYDIGHRVADSGLVRG